MGNYALITNNFAFIITYIITLYDNKTEISNDMIFPRGLLSVSSFNIDTYRQSWKKKKKQKSNGERRERECVCPKIFIVSMYK